MRVSLLIITLVGCASLVCADQGISETERDIIVKWRSPADALDAVSSLMSVPGIENVGPALPVDPRDGSGLGRISVVTLNSTMDADSVIDVLRNDLRVEYAEPRPIRFTDDRSARRPDNSDPLDGSPNDPYYNQQWGLQQIGIESAWNTTRGSPDVAIAVVDVGVWFGHPDLAGRRWENFTELHGTPGVDDDNNGYIDDIYGYDFVDQDGDPSPNPLVQDETHGTHVAGIAAATRNNSQGISGVAPECRIMGVRVGSENSIPYGYEGVYYACRAGARVINCSWGGLGESAYEHDVLDYVQSQGCVVVASAGNDGNGNPHYPAGIEGVISVAATALGDQAASFTEFGPWVKVAAPGVSIVSTILADNLFPSYAYLQGTSMSAPFVSGVCALVASRFPGISGRAIASRVCGSSDPIDQINPLHTGELGFGRVNAWRAVADSVSGLRLGVVTYVETVGNGDGRIQAGESAELNVSVINELNPLMDVFARISTATDTVIVYDAPLFYGDLPVGGPFWNTSAGLRIDLPSVSPRARILPIYIDWFNAEQRLVGRATAVVYLDSTFVSVDNGRMRLGFAENGCLGYLDYERGYYIGPGLRISGRPTNALYHGSFVLASNGYVSDNGFGNAAQSRFDWVTVPDSVAHRIPAHRSDLEAKATFEDTQAEQMLFARVNASALAWTGSDEDGFLVLEYRVTNRSVNEWAETYAGFYLDWDLGSAASNLSHYDSLSGIAYVGQVAPGHPLVGVVPLGQPWSAYYVVNNRAEIDPPADWSDSRKWQILAGGISTSPPEAMDLSHMVAIGPFDVPSHDSLTVVYALVTGADLAELRANAQSAELHYLGGQSPPPQESTSVAVGLYPNPVSRGDDIRLLLPESGTARVRFYNILGRLVAEIDPPPSLGGIHRIRTADLKGASGLLFYRIETGSGNYSGKILILR